MELLANIINGFLGIGSVAMLPVMICIMGMIFGMKFPRALKSGLLVGIGFIGLNLVFGNLRTTITPVVNSFVEQGSGFSIVDAGFPGLAAAAWATPFAFVLVPLIFLLNLLLVRIKFTKTMNVDIWNYWHFLFSGAMVYVLTNSVILGALATLGLSVVALKVSDKFAPMWQKELGIDGTSCTTLFNITGILPTMLLVNKLIDKIPKLNKIDVSLDKFHEKFKDFGDPTIIGVVVGLVMALMSRQPITTIPAIAVGVAAAIVLLPRMISLLMEGLNPIAAVVRERVKKQQGEDADIIIGLDSAVACGANGAVPAALLMIPIAIILAIILPGNRYLPYTLLPALTYTAGFATIVSKGNVFRTIILTSFAVILIVYASTFTAQVVTDTVIYGGLQVEGLINNHTATHPFIILMQFLSNLFGK